MTATDTPAAEYHWLEHYPVPMFAIVMGMAGLTLALHAAEHAFKMTGTLSTIAYVVTVALFVLISIGYAAKAIRFPAMVKAEWNHPVRVSFFPAISISFLLIAIATLPRNEAIAEIVWLIGMLGQGILTIAVSSVWISKHSFQQGHLSPAWFIPAVGNVLVPVAGAQLGYTEISWYFMSVGLIFWIILLTLVMNRLVFHDPLPGRLQPTLVILIAPPAVAFVAWVRLTGGVDHFAHLLVNGGYLFALIVATQLPKILKLPFALSFWALSFPMAAGAISSFLYAGQVQSAVHKGIGLVFLAALVAIILGLLVRTAKALANDEIFHPE